MGIQNNPTLALEDESTIDNRKPLGFYRATIPIIISVFAVYLTIGMTLGVLPEFIQFKLQYPSWVVGLVIGIQSLASLATRAYSGRITDTMGAKVSKTRGIILVISTGVVYVLSAAFPTLPILSLTFVIAARIVHGVAESLLVTGALTWGIGLAGHQNSGRVMTWNGIAMYAGIAIGAPLSIFIAQHEGVSIAFSSILILPLISWLTTSKLPTLKVDASHVRTPFYKVIGLIAKQGLGLAFSSMAFACIASFIALFFTEKNWGTASLAFIIFGTSYVLTRVFFASLPDRYGGYKVALASLGLEAAGQLLIWFSVSKSMAIVGCALTGIGFSLVFPALGVLAIKKIKPQMRGTALGAYAAFFDLSLGLGGPVAGLIAGWINYQAIYLYGAVSCLIAILILSFKSNQHEKNS